MKGAEGFAGLFLGVERARLIERHVLVEKRPGADGVFAVGDAFKAGFGQVLGTELSRLQGPTGNGGAKLRELAFGYGNKLALPYFVFIVYNHPAPDLLAAAGFPPFYDRSGLNKTTPESPMPKKGQKSAADQRGPDPSLGEFVHRRLRDAIRQGRYRPGSRIRETEVAKWLDVSRTPVREAFRRLHADGLLTLTPWRGAEVALLKRDQVVELYAMRRVLEGAAAGQAAEHATGAEVDLLFELLEKSGDAAGDPALLAENNRLFHQALYTSAHNRYLLQSSNALADSLALLGPTTYEVPGREVRAGKDHAAIAQAIKKGDANEAERKARAHIADAEKARLLLLFGDE